VASPVRPILTLLAGVTLFVGLPLLGWGLTDVRGFIGDPARSVYVVLTLLMQSGVVILVPGVGRNRRGGEQIVRRQRLAVAALQVATLAIVVMAPYCDRRNVATLGELRVVRYCGLLLYALGTTGMHWAEAALGRFFSVDVAIQAGHQLVTRGPFRYLRHPRYASILLFSTGISLTFRSWGTLVLVAAMIAVLVWRIHDEEALLRRQFGAAWEAYARKSWRLLPLVY
jgi:protein-S-isoprenylcysteine O-methyltransferase Ste14